jgi:hypothetical protein
MAPPPSGSDSRSRVGLSIYRHTANQQRRQYVVRIIISKNEDSASRWRNSNVTHRWHSQLTSIGQMNRKRHKRPGCDQASDVRYHRPNLAEICRFLQRSRRTIEAPATARGPFCHLFPRS